MSWATGWTKGGPIVVHWRLRGSLYWEVSVDITWKLKSGRHSIIAARVTSSAVVAAASTAPTRWWSGTMVKAKRRAGRSLVQWPSSLFGSTYLPGQPRCRIGIFAGRPFSPLIGSPLSLILSLCAVAVGRGVAVAPAPPRKPTSPVSLVQTRFSALGPWMDMRARAHSPREKRKRQRQGGNASEAKKHRQHS